MLSLFISCSFLFPCVPFLPLLKQLLMQENTLAHISCFTFLLVLINLMLSGLLDSKPLVEPDSIKQVCDFLLNNVRLSLAFLFIEIVEKPDNTLFFPLDPFMGKDFILFSNEFFHKLTSSTCKTEWQQDYKNRHYSC